MSNQLEVEVTWDECFVYKAFVEDVLDISLKLRFEKNWKPVSEIAFEKIRLPPEASKEGFKATEIVEVRQNDNAAQIDYWRLAVLTELDLNTGRWWVTLINGKNKNHRVKLKLSDIRHVNDKPPIGKCTFSKVEFAIPKQLREIAANSDAHDEFRKHVQADVCLFIPEKNVLRVISRHGEVTRKRVDLLKDLHLEHLKDFVKESDQAADGGFREEFEVAEGLMGLALGKKYSNVKEARKIQDVTKVELIEGTLRIQICGKTAEAVKTARNMMEYLVHRTTIPMHLAEEILEDDGKIIEEIVQQSGLVRIESGEDEDEINEESNYPIIFVGTRSCIENAEVLLQYQLRLAERRLKKKSETKSAPSVQLIHERVPVGQNLRGLAIGKNYANIKEAEKIPGVVEVEIPPEMPLFIIHAENTEAAKAARRLLEYDEDTVEVEKKDLGKIIGKSGITVKKIENSCKGVHVRIPSEVKPADLTRDGKVIIRISGPAHSVPEAIELVKKAVLYGHL